MFFRTPTVRERGKTVSLFHYGAGTMDISEMLVDRLTLANPGWEEWGKLISLVKSLPFEKVEDEHLGTYYTSDHPLVFAEPSGGHSWPAWLPAFVPALFGLKVDDWGMAGGFADAFFNEPAIAGAVFSPAGNDEELGFPPIDVPQGVYYFQMNGSGAMFFINETLDILYPNALKMGFEKLDTLEQFARNNIERALVGEAWYQAYPDLEGYLID